MAPLQPLDLSKGLGQLAFISTEGSSSLTHRHTPSLAASKKTTSTYPIHSPGLSQSIAKGKHDHLGSELLGSKSRPAIVGRLHKVHSVWMGVRVASMETWNMETMEGGLSDHGIEPSRPQDRGWAAQGATQAPSPSQPQSTAQFSHKAGRTELFGGCGSILQSVEGIQRPLVKSEEETRKVK